MKLRHLGFCIIGLAFANASHAATVAVPLEVEVGGEYQLQLFNTDDGLRSDATRTKETDFAIKAAKFSLRGKLSDAITWNVLYQADNNLLERYWVTNKLSDALEVSVGKVKIKTYGWHRKLSSSATYPVRAAILGVNPLTDKMAVDLVYKFAGTFSLAFVKDYFDPNTANCSATVDKCKSWNGYEVQKQPAVAFEWAGSFGDFQPLLQYASYDRNHSSTASVGLRYKNDLIDAYVDYDLDTRNAKGVDASGKAEDQKNEYSGVVLYGEYFTGAFTPYLLFSTLDFDDYVAPGAKSVKTNGDGRLDDNERTYSIGVFYENYGKFYRPYLGLAVSTGNYADAKSPGEDERRTKTDVLVGLTGKF